MKVVYVAGPFRGPTVWNVEENIRRAERIGFDVANAGAMPLIPHSNTGRFQGTLTDGFWLDGTMELLRRCDAVLTVSGWQDSTGAKAEVAEAKRLKIPVFHLADELAAWLQVVERAP